MFESLKKQNTKMKEGDYDLFQKEQSEKLLEEIYKFETVDLNTVKKVEKKKEHALEKPAPSARKIQQYEIELPGTEKEWIKSFKLLDPVSVLNLSLVATKALALENAHTVEEALQVTSKDALKAKGIGQGIVSEIKEKLKAFQEKEELYFCQQIHFDSLLRALVSSLSFSHQYLLLLQYRLEQYALGPLQESSRLKGLSPIDQGKLLEEAKRLVLTLNPDAILKPIIDSFIIPWLRTKKGIARKHEILERLYLLSSDRKVAKEVLAFIQALWPEALWKGLFSLGEEVCALMERSKLYAALSKEAKSYFYMPNLSYEFSELKLSLENFLAREWMDAPLGAVERFIKTSPVIRRELIGKKVILFSSGDVIVS